MRKYRELWRGRVAAALAGMLADAGLPAVDAASVTPETPPTPELGDIAFPMFPFARSLRKAPPAIAAEVARRVGAAPGVAGTGRIVAEGPYVNIHLERAGAIHEILADVEAEGARFGAGTSLDGQRIMLEFSCPNTNKPLHLGHLRNDAIGESLSRIMRAAGGNGRYRVSHVPVCPGAEKGTAGHRAGSGASHCRFRSGAGDRRG